MDPLVFRAEFFVFVRWEWVGLGVRVRASGRSCWGNGCCSGILCFFVLGFIRIAVFAIPQRAYKIPHPVHH